MHLDEELALLLAWKWLALLNGKKVPKNILQWFCSNILCLKVNFCSFCLLQLSKPIPRKTQIKETIKRILGGNVEFCLLNWKALDQCSGQ